MAPWSWWSRLSFSQKLSRGGVPMTSFRGLLHSSIPCKNLHFPHERVTVRQQKAMTTFHNLTKQLVGLWRWSWSLISPPYCSFRKEVLYCVKCCSLFIVCFLSWRSRYIYEIQCVVNYNGPLNFGATALLSRTRFVWLIFLFVSIHTQQCATRPDIVCRSRVGHAFRKAALLLKINCFPNDFLTPKLTFNRGNKDQDHLFTEKSSTGELLFNWTLTHTPGFLHR